MVEEKKTVPASTKATETTTTHPNHEPTKVHVPEKTKEGEKKVS